MIFLFKQVIFRLHANFQGVNDFFLREVSLLNQHVRGDLGGLVINTLPKCYALCLMNMCGAVFWLVVSTQLKRYLSNWTSSSNFGVKNSKHIWNTPPSVVLCLFALQLLNMKTYYLSREHVEYQKTWKETHPGDSKWPFDPPVKGHLTSERVT